jgi:uncharacterized protein YceH (UPF0502 family)
MDRYNLRTTSLNDTQLTTELTKRGAKTFGSVRRKQQRLQRFIDAENNRKEAQETLRVVIQRRIYGQAEARVVEARRSGRISQLIAQYLGY